MTRAILLIGLLAAIRVHAAPAPSPRAELKAAVEQLQKAPDDAALREKIIKLAGTVKPAPAVPEEARKHFVGGVTLQKEAKNPQDYGEAIAEYREALLLAPWWADAYFNLATVAEAAEKLDASIEAMKLYIATKPAEPEARKALDHLYALEAKQKKAEKARAAKADIERAEQEKYGWLLGSWRYDYVMSGASSGFDRTGAAEGKKEGERILVSQTTPSEQNILRAAIEPSGGVTWEFWGGEPKGQCDAGWQPINVSVGSDRRTLTLQRRLPLLGRCEQFSRFTENWTFTHE